MKTKLGVYHFWKPKNMFEKTPAWDSYARPVYDPPHPCFIAHPLTPSQLRRNQRVMSQFGNACCSLLTPLPLTCASVRYNSRS